MSYGDKIFNSHHGVFDWKVTRSLVSYDKFPLIINKLNHIERSPDHWWVTTEFDIVFSLSGLLKGHQIIGELRQSKHSSRIVTNNWKVTRSLVSYDHLTSDQYDQIYLLKGHQITGELRLRTFLIKKIRKLKGHQIIGELRQIAGQLPLSVRRIYCSHPQQRHIFSNYLSTSYSCTIKCIFQFQC